MLNDFFINVLILVAVTFVGGHLMKDIPIKANNKKVFKLIAGVFCGAAGILLMIYSLHIIETNTLMDLRAYAIMIASYVGGVVPTIISAIIILMFRILYYGWNMSSLAAVIQIVLYILFFYYVDKLEKVKWKRWIYKSIFMIVVVLLSDYLVIRSVSNVVMILLQYMIVLIIAGVMEYLLLDSVKTSNDLYRRYKQDSTKDFLTGLFNTRQFDKILNMAFERTQQNNESLSCLMIDIDHFKRINDTYGHATGDLVLKELADILTKSIRTVDIAGRVGGEEFCVLLFATSKEQVFEIALRINKAVQEHKFPIGDNKTTHITVSIGVSMYPEMTNNLDTLKEMADTALYIAKRSGRNRVCDGERCVMN